MTVLAGIVDLETGDLSQFDSTSVAAGSTLAAEAASAISGSNGLHVQGDESSNSAESVFGRLTFTTSSTSIVRVTAEVAPQSTQAVNRTGAGAKALVMIADGSGNRMAWLGITNASAGTLRLQLTYRSKDGSDVQVAGGSYSISDASERQIQLEIDKSGANPIVRFKQGPIGGGFAEVASETDTTTGSAGVGGTPERAEFGIIQVSSNDRTDHDIDLDNMAVHDTVADVVILTQDASNAAATNTQDAIEANGWTTAIIEDSNVASTDFSVYDVIVMVRPDGTARATIASEIRDEIDNGKPTVLGLVETGNGNTNNSANAVAVDLDLITGFAQRSHTSGVETIDITDATHDITDEFGTGLLQVVNTGGDYVSGVANGESFVGDDLAIATVGTQANRENLIAIESGTLDLLGVSISARVVIWGTLYGGQVGYHQNGIDLIGAILDWVTTEAIGSSQISASDTDQITETEASSIFDSLALSASDSDEVGAIEDALAVGHESIVGADSDQVGADESADIVVSWLALSASDEDVLGSTETADIITIESIVGSDSDQVLEEELASVESFDGISVTDTGLLSETEDSLLFTYIVTSGSDSDAIGASEGAVVDIILIIPLLPISLEILDDGFSMWGGAEDSYTLAIVDIGLSIEVIEE